MKNISFKSWLLHQHKRNDPVGDSAREFRADYRTHSPADRPLPKPFTYKSALAYLEAVNASDGFIRSFEMAHDEWLALKVNNY